MFKTKHIIHILAILFLSYINIFANDDIQANLKPQEIKSKILYTSFTYLPKVVYTNQKFKVKIKANILISRDLINYTLSSDINTTDSTLSLLNEDIIWEKIDDNNYETTLQFKSLEQYFKFPKITISVLDYNNTVFSNSTLKQPDIIFRNISINKKLYSNVLATELKVYDLKTKQYLNDKLIHTIILTAKDSNLEDFHLNDEKYEHQEIKLLTKIIDDQQMLYYSVVSNKDIRYIKFNYFNTKENKFINIDMPINTDETLVSTQTNLNPYDNNLFIYKIIGITIVVLIFLIIYMLTKHIFFLFLSIVSISFFIYMIWPNKKITIKKGDHIYILPTKNSTTFSIQDKDTKAEVLIKKDKFYKIILPNKTIGWVRRWTD